MALKDWIKTRDNKEHIEFRKKNYPGTGYSEVSIIKDMRNSIYSVHIPYRSIEHFRTKTSALKFAKSYMKNH